MKLTELLNEDAGMNKKVKQLLDRELKDLSKGKPNHQWAVMHILMGALGDANFHSEAKGVAKLFSKAKYEGDPQGMKDLEEMYHYELGPEVANICKWDGKDIVNAMGFYISMTIGRPLGQKVETLVENAGMRIFKESVYKSLNEVSATKLLQSVAKGESSRVEGIKLSKEMAEHFLYWIRTSPFGKKYGGLPFYKLFTAAFNWGLHRYMDSSLKGEYEVLKKQAAEMAKKK